ncbi:MAG: hypothetical protein KKA64_04160 [Nanoarchaeota archaeon]|nr:hypothetical protein [Nanoarchaeota archaeon]
MPYKKIISVRDCNYKSHTQDCDDRTCGYYCEIEGIHYCGWGKEPKILEQTLKEKRCRLKDKQPSENPSIKCLEEIFKHAVV